MLDRLSRNCLDTKRRAWLYGYCQGNDASGKPSSDYEGLENARMARTPRTAPQYRALFIFDDLACSSQPTEDNILSEVRNTRSMTIAQTPLLGDENTPLHLGPGGGTGFEGATPRHQVAFTPNPLATPLHGGGGTVFSLESSTASFTFRCEQERTCNHADKRRPALAQAMCNPSI